MAKYKQVFDEMIFKNKELFDSFKEIHDKYSLKPKEYQQQFNKTGEEVQMVIRKYENMLCKHSESGGFGKFSSGLAEKFWEEIQKMFPKIDEIGVI